MIPRRFIQFVSIAVLSVAAFGRTGAAAQQAAPAQLRLVRADIVAMDQLLVYNRFGSYNPFGMIFALGRDTESRDTPVVDFTAADCAAQIGTEGRAWSFDPAAKSENANSIKSIAGNARLRDCKRPRPLVIRGAVGDVLEIRLANLLLSHGNHRPYAHDVNAVGPDGRAREKPGYTDTFCTSQKVVGATKPAKRYGGDVKGLENDEDALRDASKTACDLAAYGESGSRNWVAEHPEKWNQPPAAKSGNPHLTAKSEETDWPSTRHVSLVINGLTNLPDAGEKIDPACRGLGAVQPGAIVTCRWALDRDGTHFISSLAAVAGGEGDGGSLTHGLFGALIIEPPGAKAYRSQVTSSALDMVWPRATGGLQHARATAAIAPADYDRVDTGIRQPRPVPAKAEIDVRKALEEANATRQQRGAEAKGRPVLNMLRDTGETDEIAGDPMVEREGKMVATRRVRHEVIHADLNAIIDEPVAGGRQSFREFTAILHDELKTFYTDNYLELALFGHGQLAGTRDGFAINYGASGMGTMLIANRKRIGPAADCVDCLYEESFLQSWVNGDPALLEHYPDDPSNVHHSYLNDRVVFRNFHAGPKETHIFHLHAHQWFAGNDRNRGSYLDSQTVGPQQGFSYRIYGGGQDRYGLPSTAAGLKLALGAGNANRTPGDSIFHCHLYPHFAQGMWALWRNHDVLEDGTRLLPDGQDHAGLSTEVRKAATKDQRLKTRGGTFLKSGKNLLGDEKATPETEDFLHEASMRPEIIGGGTPIPAIVPLPNQPAPVLPTYGEEGMPGYPFYIPGQAGRRAPQAPMDLARKLGEPKTVAGASAPPVPVMTDEVLDGGLPRHVVESGVRAFEASAGHAEEDKFADRTSMAATATATLARSLALANFGAHLKRAKVKLLPYDGTLLERRAMAFHHDGKLPGASMPLKMTNPKGEPANYDPASASYGGFVVNGSAPRPGAPFADPCALPYSKTPINVYRWPNGRYADHRTISPVIDLLTPRPTGGSVEPDLMPDPGLIGFRRYEVSAIQLRLVVNRAGWHDPQSRINILTSESDKGEHKNKTRGDVEPFFFRAHSGECIEFRHTNELPKDLARDDFQVKTPTDTIGQHIHLVKFDVMAADGSANGWNYEDGTFAPDEIHHRICAASTATDGTFTAPSGEWSYASPILRLHGRICKVADLPKDKKHPASNADKHKNDTPDLEIYKYKRDEGENWKLFQTTVQRWFADPLLTPTGRDEQVSQMPEMRDRTLRTVFTHDHFGPSSIQQHGFYSALVIEPPMSMICEPEAKGGATPCTDETAGAYRPNAMHYYVAGGPTHVGARKLVLANAERVQDERDAAQLAIRAAQDKSTKSTASSDRDIAAKETTSERSRQAIAESNGVLKSPPATPEEKAAEEKKAAAEAESAKAQKSKEAALASANVEEMLRDLNMREYALAIADFAMLYDPYGKRPDEKFYGEKGGTATGDGRSNARGLDCLIIEARIKSDKGGSNALSKGCEPAHEGGMKAHVEAGNVPPAHLAKLYPNDATALAEQTRDNIRSKWGYPISPPQRPESISVDHHDPYLVNYKNEPMPLRVGTSSSSDNDEDNRRLTCAALRAINATQFKKHIAAGKVSSQQVSIDRQRNGERGDMSNIFRSTHDPDGMGDIKVLHSDPCTPILEAYEGERMQIRLIQGAQEVQHAFTLEGYTFPRNIDQRFPSQSILPPHYAGWLDAARTRQRECFENNRLIPLADRLSQLLGREVSKLKYLRGNCDNIDGRIASQEIGISEHFEFASAFNADGATAVSPREYRLDKSAELSNMRASKSMIAEAINRGQGDAQLNARRLVMASIGGDNIFHFGSQDAQWNGAWGLVRIAHDTAGPDIASRDTKSGETEGSKSALPSYIDHSLCLAGLSPSGDARYICEADLESRLTRLREVSPRVLKSGIPQSTDYKRADEAKAKPRGQNFVRPAANFTIDCPVDNATDTVYVAAIRQGLLPYSAKLRDHDALRLVPDDGTGTLTAAQLAEQAPNGPLVIHMGAGRCLRLVVRNLLPSTLDGHIGDARMPGITSLNVDHGQWDVKTGHYKAANASHDAARLRHSSRLALSIPLTTTMARSETPAPFGVNYTGASWPGETQTLGYYAGTMRVSWDSLEERIKDSKAGAGQPLPGACSSFQFSDFRNGFADINETSFDLLGKRYAAKVAWIGDEPQPVTPEAMNSVMRACLLALIAETKLPEPYAFGAVPIKSFGDVIGHTAHGMIGAVVVSPADARTRLESRSDFPADCGAPVPAMATTSITARNCLPQAVHLPADANNAPAAGDMVVLKRSVVSEHVLFWQDGLNLGDSSRNRKRRPVADCHNCDDSYDFGKRGVSYRAGMLTERIGQAGKSGWPAVHGAFDLNRVSIPRDIYAPGAGSKALHLPPLFSRTEDEVTFRLVHPGGRARQRAFVMTGAGYEDLFPGFGFPSSALLAPGKAISATLLRPARDKECNLWRDGPSYMVGQGVWGLHAVGGPADNAGDICKAAAR